MESNKIQPLRTKIAMAIVLVVALSLIGVGLVFLINSNRVSKSLIDAEKELSQTSRSLSSSSMENLMRVRLQELAEDKADLADRTFYEFRQAVSMVASAAERLYADSGAYPEQDVPLPDADKDGELSLQVLYASDVDPEDSLIVQEKLLLGNLQETIYTVNLHSENIASVYFASEKGVMVQADYISARKFDEAGKIMPLDAKTRPWYAGAASTGDIFITSVTQDAHTPRMAIMCGVPAFHEGRLMGVAGAGMYLDSISEMVESVDLGDKGNICIVNDLGRILFSNFKEGSLSVEEGSTDLRLSSNPDMKSLANDALSGGFGVRLLEIDGKFRYVAFAPMKTVGWSVFIVLSRDEVDEPTVILQNGLDRISAELETAIGDSARTAAGLLLTVFVVALFASLFVSVLLSNRIVRPIRKLTDEVGRLKGDDLDFKWDEDTGDETQLLAEAFESLTGRMKTYVEDIRTITAEKERIGTELELATRIQTGMLPSTFPAFPDRKDFDIFASMTPAKEVGGDFYDFFMLDEDRLALLIADVSGKGVPAALFMMGSMIMLRSSVENGLGPAQTLRKVNDQICAGNREDMFVTVWLGILDLKTGKFTAANAGHEYPVLKQADGHFELIRDPHGLVLGALPDEDYIEYEWQLQPGAKVFIYTDGIPEAGEKRTDLFGTDRLVEALRRAEDERPERILEAVDEAVRGFVGSAPQFDDLTMLCVEYVGREE